MLFLFRAMMLIFAVFIGGKAFAAQEAPNPAPLVQAAQPAPAAPAAANPPAHGAVPVTPVPSPALAASPKPQVAQNPTSQPKPAISPAASAPQVSQGDPRWKSLTLAHGVTIGKAGCLFVSLFTSVIEMGYNFDLTSFLDLFKENDLFDRFGRLRWDIQKAIPGLSAERLMLTGAAALAAAKERIADGGRILLQVVTSRGTRHWIAVLATSGSDFIVADPNGGKTGTLSDLYGGARAVTGLSVLTQH